MSTTNLLQTYLNNPTATQKPKDTISQTFDVHKELNNRTFIKPLKSNGKLVRKNLFDIPSEFAKDLKYDFDAFIHATQGKANDHELGKLNDVGLKLGGLSIASYLCTRKQTPMTKLFEFVGLASFLGSMEIWPKLFIQLPAYLIHGVNVRQEYRDSYGRKKLFYQDHQFIPWDLYSDKEIDKIGNRLHVPQNIPNRRDYIQEKMRKIALQNNTLWMLTSGFATPLLSALICNGLENVVSKYQDNKNNLAAEKLLTNFTQEIEKYKFHKNSDKLEHLLAENKNKPISEELLKNIGDILTEGLDEVTASNLKIDLKDITKNINTYTIDEQSVENLIKMLETNMGKAKIPTDIIPQILPKKELLIQKLSEQNLLTSGVKEFSEHSKTIQNILDENISQYAQNNPESTSIKRLEFFMNQLRHSKSHTMDSEIAKIFKQKSSAILDDANINLYKSIGATIRKFRAGTIILDKYAFMKVAQAPETVLGNAWNEVSNTLMKSLNFTNKEIKLARIDREFAGKILREKLETISSNPQEYNTFINKMEQVLSNLHSKMTFADSIENELGHVKMENTNSQYINCTNTTYKNAADALYQKGLTRTAQSLIGFEDTSRTSARDLQLSFVRDRIQGVKNSFYRFLNFADLYRRISTVENVEHALEPNIAREVKEEMVELAKQVMLDGHSSDFAVKFFQKRNPTPNRSDTSQIVVEAGKVKNKYFGTHAKEQVTELLNDSKFFKSVMRLMYDGDLHQDTRNAIQNSVFYQEFLKYRKDILNFIGGDQYFAMPKHITTSSPISSSSEFKFLLTGCAPDEILYKAFNQKYNSNKWFSIFGKMTAGLIAVTIIAQFFFGRNHDGKESK